MRVRYHDGTDGPGGELELADVRVGDLIRFLDDFRRLAGPKGVFEVRKDEVGEVLACGPEHLRVRVPATRLVNGDRMSEDLEDDVEPARVAVLVDARDARIEGRRARRALEAWELEMFVDDIAEMVDPFARHRVVTELVRRRRTAAAVVVARATMAAWQAFVLAAGFGVRRVRAEDVVEFLDRFGWYAPEAYDLAVWAVQAASFDPTGTRTRTLDLARRGDVVGALDELIADISGGPYETHPSLEPTEEGYEYIETVDPTGTPDTSAHVRETVGELQKARQFIAGMSDALWTEFAGLMQARKQRKPPMPDPQVLPVGRPQAPEAPPVESLPPPPPAVAPEPAFEPVDESVAEEEAADPTIAYPISLPPGAGYGHVYADPGMRVYSRPHKVEGDVLGGSTTVPDGIVVDVDGDVQTWDAMSVMVSHRWKGPRRVVKFDEVDAWKKQRRMRPRHANCYMREHGRSLPDEGATSDISRDPGPARAGRSVAGPSAGGRGAHRGDGSRIGGPEAARTHRPGVGALVLLASREGGGNGRRRRALAPLGIKGARRPNLFWEDEQEHTGADGPTSTSSITFREATPAEFEAGIQQVDQTALDQDRDYTTAVGLFVSSDGKAGYALSHDGEMKWVWSIARGYGKAAVADAVRRGAHHLSAFDNGKLVQFYRGTGFGEFRREPNWTPGEPDVVFMRLPDSPAGTQHEHQTQTQPRSQPLPQPEPLSPRPARRDPRASCA